MSEPDELTDSPTDWVAAHIREYVSSGGKKGARFYGHEALLLTTGGRRSGRLRRTALYYGVDGDRYVLVASDGGAPADPNWYRNLAADPGVVIQVGTETFGAFASTATGTERARLWELMVGVFPKYAQYQAKAGREIPVVIIERAVEAT
ncbi:MAG: nitroreductase family deazaflavin-dependent oxidoreductase [Labedaea sp.]